MELTVNLRIRMDGNEINMEIEGFALEGGARRQMTPKEAFSNLHKAVGTYMDLAIPQEKDNVILLPTQPTPYG